MHVRLYVRVHVRLYVRVHVRLYVRVLSYLSCWPSILEHRMLAYRSLSILHPKEILQVRGEYCKELWMNRIWVPLLVFQ